MGFGSTLPPGGVGHGSGRQWHDRGVDPAVPRRLTSLLDHVATVEQTLAADRGPFDLFALVRRADAHRWDVVAAAPWLDDSDASIQLVADALKAVVGGDGMIDFSRVVILPADSDFLADLRDAYQATDNRRRLAPGQYGRVDVDDGFLIRHRSADGVAGDVPVDTGPSRA